MEGAYPSLNISISGTPQQRHLGFEVIDQGSTLIYHLAFHCMYSKETREDYLSNVGKYLQVELGNFTPHEKLHISRHLEVIHSRAGSAIPYGFNFVADTVLTVDGDLVEGISPGSGLTCSTFVLQVLRNQSFDIIDIDSWEGRAEDQQWQESILELLRRYAGPAHADALQDCVGQAVRFKPEEVAGCAREFDEVPIKFAQGVELGALVYGEMQCKGCL